MSNTHSDIKIFSGSASREFTAKMCAFLNVPPGRSACFPFSEGNTYVKIEENVREKDVFLVQTIGFNANNAFMELLFWIDAFKRSSTRSVTVIMPYFSYAKADKKDEPRVSIRARVCADCIEAVGADRVIALDLHSPQIQGFFKIPVDHLYASPLLCAYMNAQAVQDLVVVSPDAGFAKNARKYADLLKAPTALCNKTRKDHSEEAEILEMIGDVRGKTALIVDDFTLSCGTLVEAAKKVKQNGAKQVFAMVSHALLSEKGVRALEQSPIDQLIITDTVHNPALAAHPKIKLISVAPLMAEAVRIIHRKASLSELFDRIPATVLQAAYA